LAAHLSAALRKHLIGLESPPPQTREALAAALARLGRVLEARSDAWAGLATNSNFTVARFRADALADAPLVAGPEHFVDGLRKARVPEE
jgi:hypothetical protein